MYNRRKEHISKLRRGRHHSAKLQNAWSKYGEDAFDFEVVRLVDVCDLIAAEQSEIDRTGCVEFGYNIAPKAGSTLGIIPSLATREKMSAAQKAVPLHIKRSRVIAAASAIRTEEWRANISRSMTGKRLSPEHREKLSQAAKARSAEARQKIAEGIRASDRLRGGRHSEASKAKTSKALTGRRLSEAHKEALKAAWVKRRANSNQSMQG